MRVAIYKDTLANRRGADKAVISLAEGLREKLVVSAESLGGCVGNEELRMKNEELRKGEKFEVVLFEKAELEQRLKEHWDVFIVTGTNELLDLFNEELRIKNEELRKDKPFPVIMQFHTNPKSQFKWKRFRRNRRIRAALKCVDAIQVLREAFVPQVAKYGVRVEVIGNWSNINEKLRIKNEELQCDFHSLTQTSNSNHTVIYPAAFSKGKNQKLLIKAFSKVAKDFPDWKLRLLGRAEGRYSEECKRLVCKLGLTDRVEFPGFSDDMAKEYAECAFVAFPSVDEGFGLVIVDAASFGKPAIMVEDWIGLENEELRIKNEELSRSVNNNDRCIITKSSVKAYAEGLRRLMSDPKLCQKMGEQAKAYCEDRYTRERILGKWVELLEDVARQNSSKYKSE